MSSNEAFSHMTADGHSGLRLKIGIATTGVEKMTTIALACPILILTLLQAGQGQPKIQFDAATLATTSPRKARGGVMFDPGSVRVVVGLRVRSAIAAPVESQPGDSLPDIFKALERQPGLKLKKSDDVC